MELTVRTFSTLLGVIPSNLMALSEKQAFTKGFFD